jgi:hypothetical protein
LATQSDPNPTASAVGPVPDVDHRRHLIGLGADPKDAVAGLVAHPDRFGSGGDIRRPSTERDRVGDRAGDRVDPGQRAVA